MGTQSVVGRGFTQEVARVSSLFPKWMNAIPTLGAVAGVGGLLAVVTGGWYYLTPDFYEVGYMPKQPGSGFNHQIHAGMLGLDCRYCHTHVEESPHANVPSVATCNGCHSAGKLDNKVDPAKVQFIRTAYADNASIEWRNIHVVPDYAHFPHHVHVAAGVSCYSCHGQIRGMPVVYQAESLAMGWCLDCHRNKEQYLVPPEKVTDLIWVQEEWMSKPLDERSFEGVTPAQLVETLRQSPPQHCAACHY